MLTLTMAQPCPTSSEKPEGSCRSRSRVQEELRHGVMIYLLLSLRLEGGLESSPAEKGRPLLLHVAHPI